MKKIKYNAIELTAFTAIFVSNFLFIGLFVIMPKIVYRLSSSTGSIGRVMITYVASLILVRSLALKKYIIPQISCIIGISSLTIFFILLFYFPNEINSFYYGAILLGTAVAFVPPSIMTIISSTENKASNIVIYNIIIGLSSALGPINGELIYKKFANTFFLIGFVSLIIVLLLLYINIYKNKELNLYSEKKFSIQFIKTKFFLKILFLLIIISISYGSITTYMPIVLDTYNKSAGFYFFLFWSSFISAQYFSLKLKFIQKERIFLILVVLDLIIALSIILLFKNTNLLYLSAPLYGFGWGCINYYVYSKISQIENVVDKNSGFAIVGLVSFFGVGLASVIFSPLLKKGIINVYMGSLVISLLLFIILIINLVINKTKTSN